MPVRNYYQGGAITRDVVFPLQGQAPQLADGRDCVGMWSGERRPPQEGEWYIHHGRCHRADGRLSRVYPIARIHPVKRTGLVEIEAMPIDRFQNLLDKSNRGPVV